MKLTTICPHCNRDIELTTINLSIGVELIMVAIGFIAGVLYAGGI